jgi:hypothetical protein
LGACEWRPLAPRAPHLRINVREVFGAELSLDRLEVAHGVDRVIHMHDAVCLECANDVDQCVDGLDVRKECVSKASTLACAANKARDVGDMKICRILARGLPQVYQRLVARVRDSYTSGRRIDRTEWVVLRWDGAEEWRGGCGGACDMSRVGDHLNTPHGIR